MRRALVALSAGLLLGGCLLGPDYKRPPLSPPAVFRGEEPATATVAGPTFGDLEWEQLFKDDELRGLVRRALAANYDVRIAAARVLEARAQVGVARAAFFPQLSIGATAGQFRASQTVYPYPLPVSGSDNFTFGGALGFEFDLWGKIRRANEASRAQLLASEEAKATVLSSLVAEVATAYLQLRELDLEPDISRRTLESRRASLRLVKLRKELGVSTGLEVSQAAVLVDFAAAVIPNLQRLIEQTENQIRLLLGEPPGPVTRGLPLAEQGLTLSLAPGLPSSLLERRPDIRQAEENLIAANANIGVAKAQMFPQLTLTAVAGQQTAALSQLMDGASGFWSFAGNLLQPVFQGGRLWFTFQATKARQQQVLVDYERTIQQAFREVADGLVANQKNREVRTQNEELTVTARKYLRLSTMQYEGGVASYLEVLDADTRLYAAEIDLARARLAVLLSVVQVYRALGGGWQTASLASSTEPSGEPKTAEGADRR